MVNVYEGDEVVARVSYNLNLDIWDGSNWTCGSVGRHKGITKLKDGRFVLIHGTQWQDEEDYAEIVDDSTALNEILKSGNTKLLEEKKFSTLKELAEKKNLINSECED